MAGWTSPPPPPPIHDGLYKARICFVIRRGRRPHPSNPQARHLQGKTPTFLLTQYLTWAPMTTPGANKTGHVWTTTRQTSSTSVRRMSRTAWFASESTRLSRWFARGHFFDNHGWLVWNFMMGWRWSRGRHFTTAGHFAKSCPPPPSGRLRKGHSMVARGWRLQFSTMDWRRLGSGHSIDARWYASTYPPPSGRSRNGHSSIARGLQLQSSTMGWRWLGSLHLRDARWYASTYPPPSGRSRNGHSSIARGWQLQSSTTGSRRLGSGHSKDARWYASTYPPLSGRLMRRPSKSAQIWPLFSFATRLKSSCPGSRCGIGGTTVSTINAWAHIAFWSDSIFRSVWVLYGQHNGRTVFMKC